MGSAAALAIVAKLAPIIADAMAPEVAALFKSLPLGLVATDDPESPALGGDRIGGLLGPCTMWRSAMMPCLPTVSGIC